MPIPVERDPDQWLERCCFCRRSTSYWHTPKDVAVCLPCTETHEPEDVPTKAEWCAKEDSLTPKRWG